MIKELMHDPIFLAGKSEVATKEDLQVAQDLLDTLMAHRESCVGMAANMIGVRKRIIAFLVRHQRIKQILCDLQIFFCCDIRLPCKEYRIVHQFFYHFLTYILLND